MSFKWVRFASLGKTLVEVCKCATLRLLEEIGKQVMKWQQGERLTSLKSARFC